MSDRSRVLVSLRVNATPERAFTAFTGEIDRWWQPNGLFEFTRGRTGRLAFGDGELVETYDDGTRFVIGEILEWEPPVRFSTTWRQVGFADDQLTELHVRFDPAGDQTRVTVEHYGWDSIPAEHVARHGFPLAATQRRFAEWWQHLLANLETQLDP